MRKSHIYLFAVAIATLGFVATSPGAAAVQEVPDRAVQSAPALTPDQRTEFESWPTDQQTAYELWPAETQAYYWTLAPERQMLFWRLTDEDKIALTAMTGPEREGAWRQVESRTPTPPSDG